MQHLPGPVAKPASPPSQSPASRPEHRRPVFYTAAETSEILRLDESTLYRHLRNGTFPGVKIGGRYVVPQIVLERLIADVLATGRCLDLGKWTARWRAEQHATAVQRLAAAEAGLAPHMAPKGGGPR